MAPTNEHNHDHVHEGNHDHSHGHEHGHHHGHDHGKSGAVYPVVGVLGFIFGVILEHLGVTWSYLVFVVASVASGYPIARSGLKSLRAGHGATIDLLTTIAGFGALLIGEWKEGLLVLTLFSVGEFLEELAGHRAGRSIRELLNLTPRMARVKQGQDWVTVEARDVVKGSHVKVLAGERISADGTVVSGVSMVDESPITGESQPHLKREGSQVYAGTLNGEGPLEIISTKDAEDTTLSRILAMVEEARSKKARSERLVDSFAKIWTPAMICLALACALVPPIFFGAPYKVWTYRALTVLLVSCPCSLVISTPVTVVGAIARGARNGVLIKGGVHLEDLARLRAVALDKTGTVTSGKMEVREVLPVREGITEDSLLALLAGVEASSEHPLAKAVLDEAKKRGIEPQNVSDFRSVRGRGLVSVVDGKEVYVGSQELLDLSGVVLTEQHRTLADSLRERGETAVFLGDDDGLIGVVGVWDRVRSEAPDAIGEMKDMGLHVVMLTGDSRATAAAVAGPAGLNSFRASLLPGDKVAEVEKIRESIGAVAMVGDGINDAPSLAAATVGIAMGNGTDAALEIADVALVSEDLRKVPWAIELSRRALSLIKQNIFMSLCLKSAALALVLTGMLPLWLAVLSDSGAAVIVTLNGLRILRFSGLAHHDLRAGHLTTDRKSP